MKLTLNPILWEEAFQGLIFFTMMGVKYSVVINTYNHIWVHKSYSDEATEIFVASCDTLEEAKERAVSEALSDVRSAISEIFAEDITISW